MSATITELDYALNCAAIEIDTTNARAELAQLRAAAVERDDWKVRYEDAYRRWQEAKIACAAYQALHGASEEKRAELQRTVTAQAAQLEQAREIIDVAYHVLSFGDFKNGNTDSLGVVDEGEDIASRVFSQMSSWLAANAPAPQEEQSDAEREEIISQHERDTQRGLLDAWHDRM